MLTPETARHILHLTNMQVNSNTNAIKTIPTFSIIQHVKAYINTAQTIRILDKNYPA